MNIKDIKKLKVKIEASKKVIAKERDVLRKLLENLENLVISFDDGLYQLDCAKEDLEGAIEKFSEVV